MEYKTIIDLWMASWLSTGLSQSQDGTIKELKLKFHNEVANNWALYVGDLDGSIVGMLALKLPKAKMDQLFIHPDQQRLGIGKKLLDFAKLKLPEGMWLKADKKNIKAIEFYKRQGFTKIQSQMSDAESKIDVHYRWAP